MAQIFAYVTHNNGQVDDSAQELLMVAKKIDKNATTIAIVTGFGDELDAVCNQTTSYYDEVWKFNDASLLYPNSEVIRKLLLTILPENAIFLLSHCTFGIDLAPGLSVKLNSAFIADVVSIEDFNENTIRVVRQEFGGMVSTHIKCDVAGGLVLALRPGCFQFDEETTTNIGSIVDCNSKIGELSSGRIFLEVVEAEAGEVDITKADVLVSIGRGIEDEDNIEIAQELADALSTVVSCSRPIVDAKWMDKSRQVGTSGQTVKPKVYIACGISGSFQHIGGIKGSPFMIAINKNVKAPIFQIADIGIEADILDFIPKLTETLLKL